MDRYLWLLDLVLMLMGVLTLRHIFSGGYLMKAARVFLVVVFCGSFVYAPLRNLRGFFNLNRQDYAFSETIAAKYGIRGRLASCGDFIDSLYLAYQLKLPYYGSTGKAADEEMVSGILNPDYEQIRALTPARTDDDIARELTQYRVDYYLVWTGKSAPIPSFLRDLEEVTRGELSQLKIYRWKPR